MKSYFFRPIFRLGVILPMALVLLASSSNSIGTLVKNPLPVETVGAVDANIFVNLSRKIVPSVVNISTLTTLKVEGPQGRDSDDVLKKFFGELFRQYPRTGPNRGNPFKGGPGEDLPDSDEDGENENEDSDAPQTPLPIPGGPKSPRNNLPKSTSLGTGFVIDSSGLILTNNHVIADADEIKISFTEAKDETPSDAVVVGRDPDLDIALIRVKTKRTMVPAVLGDSDALQVGEYVAAVGNPFGQGHSVTHGIVSAKGRPAPDFPLANYLQTDAPINPGNSGGPLLNLKGEVVGINNAIDQRAQGIGFAIPINVVKKVLPQLKTKGVVARGYIGVLVDNLTPEIASKVGSLKDTQGCLVTHVYPKDPAAKAGIQAYDVIVSFNGTPTASGNDLIAAVTSVEIGDSVKVKVLRAGKEKTLTIKVGKRPGSENKKENTNSENKSNSTKNKKKPLPELNLGLSLEDITPETAEELGLTEKAAGAVVSNIDFGGPADKAGLLRGDVILDVDQKSIKNRDGFYTVIKEKKTYMLRVRRIDTQGREYFSIIVLPLK